MRRILLGIVTQNHSKLDQVRDRRAFVRIMKNTWNSDELKSQLVNINKEQKDLVKLTEHDESQESSRTSRSRKSSKSSSRKSTPRDSFKFSPRKLLNIDQRMESEPP